MLIFVDLAVTIFLISIISVYYLRLKKQFKENELFTRIYQFNSEQFINGGQYFITYRINTITKNYIYYINHMNHGRVSQNESLDQTINLADFLSLKDKDKEKDENVKENQETA